MIRDSPAPSAPVPPLPVVLIDEMNEWDDGTPCLFVSRAGSSVYIDMRLSLTPHISQMVATDVVTPRLLPMSLIARITHDERAVACVRTCILNISFHMS